jgi:YtkA-like
MRWFFCVILCISPPAWAQKTNARLDCKHTGKDFIYDCLIRLDPPVEGVQVTVGADMPSMPMAHSVKPAKAKPGKKPGEYRARLELEMPGEWAVKLRLAGPVRDQIVVHYEFDQRGARPAIKARAPAPRS